MKKVGYNLERRFVIMAYKKSEETRRMILEAASKLFQQKGYYNTELKEIASEAGMVHTGIYYYFKNKEEIASHLYDMQAFSILRFVMKVKNEHKPSPLFLCIMQYILIVEKLANNKMTEDYFFDMINYRIYDRQEMKRVRNTYYAALDDLFSAYNVDMSDDRMNIFILTSDSYAKSLILALKSDVTDYAPKEAFDYFFKHLLLPDIGVGFEEYLEVKNQVFDFLEKAGEELPFFNRKNLTTE